MKRGIGVSPKNILRQWIGCWPLKTLVAPPFPPLPMMTRKPRRRRPSSELEMEREDDSGESLLAANLISKPTRVPKGCLAVYVGPRMRRFVIPTSYLSVPEFGELMERVAEEFGFEQEAGGLQIPCCEEEDFEEILSRCIAFHQIPSKPKPKTKNTNRLYLSSPL